MQLIHNQTYGIRPCKSSLSQFIGLMFKSRQNLLFILKKEKIINLHMLFVFYPIDIFFLDNKFQVIKKIRAKPFQLFLNGVKAKYILELSEKNNIKEKEYLKFC